MSRRIDIEITSVNGQTATWRAAGARQPKGVLDTNLLAAGFKVGDTYRAEIEQFMEGVDVLSVAPPKAASPLDRKSERIALLVAEPKGPDVVVTYASKGRGSRDGSRGRDDRGHSDRPPRERKDADGSTRTKRPPRRTDGDSTEPRAARTGPPREGTSDRRPSERRTPGGSDRRTGRPGSGPRPAGPAQPPMATIHRNAFLATLSAEQLPVAEQLLRGGMPAVRQAVAEQNRNATAQGRPTISAEVIDRIAEELLSRANLAVWKDRATGALGAGKELRLRDLRAVVTSAKTVTLDDDARTQHKELQGALHARVEALRVDWLARLERALANNDVLEALRLTTRTPDPSTRVSSDAATKIAAMTSSALSSETVTSTWIEIVNTAIESPMRRLIKPIGIPADPACTALAVKNAGAIPEFAKLLGMKVPPPPVPTRPVRPTRRPPTRRSSSGDAPST